MFVFGAGSLLAELERCVPEISTACRAAVATARIEDGCTRLGSEFLKSPSDSIDYAVMERTESATVVPLDAGWSDVGSWSALLDVLEKDEGSNVVRGNVVTQDLVNSLVISENRKVVVIGLDDVVVIDDKDALLVMRKSSAQELKLALAKFNEDSSDE
jgi:mannose-1-phosphate guanylyltransferase